jgi:hypothetical protein
MSEFNLLISALWVHLLGAWQSMMIGTDCDYTHINIYFKSWHEIGNIFKKKTQAIATDSVCSLKFLLCFLLGFPRWESGHDWNSITNLLFP